MLSTRRKVFCNSFGSAATSEQVVPSGSHPAAEPDQQKFDTLRIACSKAVAGSLMKLETVVGRAQEETIRAVTLVTRLHITTQFFKLDAVQCRHARVALAQVFEFFLSCSCHSLHRSLRRPTPTSQHQMDSHVLRSARLAVLGCQIS